MTTWRLIFHMYRDEALHLLLPRTLCHLALQDSMKAWIGDLGYHLGVQKVVHKKLPETRLDYCAGKGI